MKNTTASTYSLDVGTADVDRLELLDEHYGPSSRAFLLSAGVRRGARIADVGCGHGAMTTWLADQVGDAGRIYGVDASAEQIEVARARAGARTNVEWICASAVEAPRSIGELDFAYCRFLLMHVADPVAVVRAMANMIDDRGRLLIEVADVAALRFVPSTPESELWLAWWLRVGEVLGASYDVSERMIDVLTAADLHVERRDRFQPASALRNAKLLHALGFQQMIPSYIELAGARPEQIERHLGFLRGAIDDARISIELYRTTQYVAVKRTARADVADHAGGLA